MSSYIQATFSSALDSFTFGNITFDFTPINSLENSYIYQANTPASSIDENAFNTTTTLLNILLPSVTNINNSAFQGCTNLTSVVFEGASNFTSISFPSVTNIGSGAFADCTSFTSFTIPTSVLSIGDAAFGGCLNLQSINISNSVINIGNRVFQLCPKLIEINVDLNNSYYSSLNGILYNKDQTNLITCPGGFIGSCEISQSVTNINDSAFLGNTKGCASLTSFIVDSSNPYYSSLNGVLYNKGQTNLITCPGGFLGNIITSNSLKTISNSAFNGCALVSSVNISDTVTSIGNAAFIGCVSISSLIIPNLVNIINDNTFYGCTNLTSFTFASDSICASIGNSAFYGCVGLTTLNIPNAVTTINSYSFQMCTGLVTFNIPSLVNNIEGSVFQGCSALTSFTVDSNNQNYMVDIFGVLYNTNKTLLIAYPAGSNETSYTIPDSVTNINGDAFYGSTNLNVIATSASSAGMSLGGCPSSVLNIYYDMTSSLITFNSKSFKNFFGQIIIALMTKTDTSYIYISQQNQSSIDNNAFFECANLVEISISSSVNNISSGAFQGCSSLTSFIVDYNNQNYMADNFGVLYDINQTLLIAYPSGLNNTSYVVPNSVINITDYAFYKSINITTVTFTSASSCTNIGNYAFYGCTNLTSCNIPKSVINVGNYAFYECVNLQQANFGSSNSLLRVDAVSTSSACESVGIYAFYKCEALLEVTPLPNCESYGDFAFAYCYRIESFSVSASLRSVGSNALPAGPNISYTVDPDNPTYSTDQYGVFYSNDQSILVKCPTSFSGAYTIPDSVTTINDGAFANCIDLTSIIISDPVKSIGNFAFFNCFNLTSAIINSSSSCTSIGEYAFCDCTNLSTINIPRLVISVDNFAFKSCYLLTSCIFHLNSICANIGNSVFEACYSLTSITIPSSITIIGVNAFKLCSSLTNMIIADAIRPLSCALTSFDMDSIFFTSNYSPLILLYLPASVNTITNSNSYPNLNIYTGSSIQSCYTSLLSIVKSVTYNVPYTINWVPPNTPAKFTEVGIIANKTTSTLYVGYNNISSSFVATQTYTCADIDPNQSSFRVVSTPTQLNYGSYTLTATGDFTYTLNIINTNFSEYTDSITIYSYDNTPFPISIIINPTTIITPTTIIGVGRTSLSAIGFNAAYFATAMNNLVFPLSFLSALLNAGFSVNELINAGLKCVFALCNSNQVVPLGYTLIANTNYIYVSPRNTTSIGDNTFNGCTGLTSLIGLSNVTSIGNGAFLGCVGLSSIAIPTGVTRIGSNTFQNCINLTSCELPSSVTSIEFQLFNGCSKLTSLVIQSTVKSIGNGAFISCRGLSSISIPQSVTIIGDDAFMSCSGLSLVTIPSSCTSIGLEAFQYCSSLSLVIFTSPSSCASIGDYAFSYCTNLISCDIPSSVTSIGANIFAGDIKLKSTNVSSDAAVQLALSSSSLSDIKLSGNVLVSLPILTASADATSSIMLTVAESSTNSITLTAV